jgi:hypothetical protein
MDKNSNKYRKALELSEKQFKRLTGIKKETAKEMIELLKTAYAKKHERRGRHSKLSKEIMLMMTLEYWRQYITFFELAFEYGVAESTVHDIVVWVENILIKSGLFGLPGKKALLSGSEIEVVLVDVTESEIERPKKNKVNIIQEKRKSIP